MVEMLIAGAIGALLIFFVGNFFSSSQEVQKVKEAKEDVLNDLSLATSSIHSASLGMYSPPEKVKCAKSSTVCAEMVGENYKSFKKEFFQFGYKCIKPTDLISKMNAVKKGLANDVLALIKKKCPINCGAGTLPVIVRNYKEDGKSWEESLYPQTHSESFDASIATASCSSLDKSKKTLKIRLVGIYLSKEKNLSPAAVIQTVAIPYFNLTDSLNILK